MCAIVVVQDQDVTAELHATGPLTRPMLQTHSPLLDGCVSCGGSRLALCFPGEQVAECRAAVGVAGVEEHAGDDLVHGLRHVDAVPVDVPRRLRAGGVDRGRAAGGEEVEVVVAAAGAAAGPEGLREAVRGGAAHDGEVGGVVVGVGDDGVRVAPAELVEGGEEAAVVRVALAVEGGDAADVVAVLGARQRHGHRQATRQRQTLHHHVPGASIQQPLQVFFLFCFVLFVFANPKIKYFFLF